MKNEYFVYIRCILCTVKCTFLGGGGVPMAWGGGGGVGGGPMARGGGGGPVARPGRPPLPRSSDSVVLQWRLHTGERIEDIASSMENPGTYCNRVT